MSFAKIPLLQNFPIPMSEPTPSQPQKRNPNPFNKKIAAHESRFESLEQRFLVSAEYIKGLEGQNNRLAANANASFEFARWVIYLFAIIIGLATAGGVASQIYFYSTVTSQHQQNMTQHRQNMVEFVELSGRVKKEAEQLTNERKADKDLLVKIQENMVVTERANTVALSTSAVVYETIATLNIGQQRLAESNPQSAIFYAKNALVRIDKTLSDLGVFRNPLEPGLRVLKRPAWILLCESYIQMDKMDALRAVASELTQCDCPEGARYSGIVALHDAIRERPDSSKRGALLVQSKTWLIASMAPKNLHKNIELDFDSAKFINAGNFDILLLSAAYFADGEFRQCAEHCREFENSANVSSDTYVRPRVRANLSLAKLLRILSESFQGKTEGFKWIDDCVGDAGVLLPAEGRILETLFSDTQTHFLSKVDNKDKASFQGFCVKAANFVRYLTAPPCKSGPSFSIDDQIVTGDKEPPPPPVVPQKP